MFLLITSTPTVELHSAYVEKQWRSRKHVFPTEALPRVIIFLEGCLSSKSVAFFVGCLSSKSSAFFLYSSRFAASANEILLVVVVFVEAMKTSDDF